MGSCAHTRSTNTLKHQQEKDSAADRPFKGNRTIYRSREGTDRQGRSTPEGHRCELGECPVPLASPAAVEPRTGQKDFFFKTHERGLQVRE